MIAITFLLINESIKENRFQQFLNEVRAEMSLGNQTNLAAKIEKNIHTFHNNAGLFPITLTHLSVYLDGNPEAEHEINRQADYTWGEDADMYTLTSYYYPEVGEGFIKVQSTTSTFSYFVPYVLFVVFSLLTAIYYVYDLLRNRKRFSYRAFLQKALIAVIASIILSLGLALYAGVIGYMIIYLIYSLPVYLIAGIPASVLVDNWRGKIKTASTLTSYLVGLGLYTLFGFIAGYLFIMTLSISDDISHISFIDELLGFMLLGSIAAIIGYHVLLLRKLI